jgi:hypothetical protein
MLNGSSVWPLFIFFSANIGCDCPQDSEGQDTRELRLALVEICKGQIQVSGV